MHADQENHLSREILHRKGLFCRKEEENDNRKAEASTQSSKNKPINQEDKSQTAKP
jgi:hypothetical protein